MATTKQSKDLQAQREYVSRKQEEGFDFGLTVAEAFVRGIRDIGYRNTCRAIDELIDNAIQAEASNIYIELGHERSESKPTAIAVVDDGHGMDPDMIRLASIWGGTHRENDRTGFGRYGYGLPSSCVSQGKRFSVYSKVAGGEFYGVTLDLEEIEQGKYSSNGKIIVPEAQKAKLPSWLERTINERYPDGWDAGTIVLIEKLDRLSWKTKTGLTNHLFPSTGTTYRNFMREVDIFIAGTKVEPIDPLFTTPGFRGYDLDEDRAEALEPIVFDVKDQASKQVIGTIKTRFSSMPPTFARADKTTSRGKNNARFSIIDDNNGLIIMRQGRQIDVVTKGPNFRINNDDRYWGCEIDIPATLDEEISITTSKQQVELSDRIWELLREQGVFTIIGRLRARYDEERAQLKARVEADEKARRASEEVMVQAEKFKTRKPADSPNQRERREERFRQEAKNRAEIAGISLEEAERLLEAEASAFPYRIVEESLPGAPFYRPEQVGSQKVVYLNTAHRFYQDVYAGPESSPRLRAAIEVLLFVFGACELDASDDRRTFYQVERGEWTIRLTAALGLLEKLEPKDESQAREAA